MFITSNGSDSLNRIGVEEKRFLVHPVVLLAIIIVLQFFIVTHYVEKKEWYHADEFFSIVQANEDLVGQTRARFDPDWFNRWNSPDYFWRFLTVQPDERFDFQNVYKNMSANIHPPFYHMQLHAVSSFFPNTWSKWFGAGINIFWLILANIMLYFAGRLILRNKFLALLPCAIWGFSAGAISTAVFFRPYATLTFFFTALLFLAALLITRERKADIKYCIAFALVLFFGFLTMIYFIIFFALVAVSLLVWLIYSKEYRQIVNCVITTAVTIGLHYWFWPYSRQYVFLSAPNTYEIAVQGDFRGGVKEYFKILDSELFGGSLIPFLVIAIVLLAICFILWRKNRHSEKEPILDKIYPVLFLIFVSIVYVLIIAKIAPDKMNRYIFAVYPSVVLLFVAFFYNSLQRISAKIAVVAIVAVAAFVIILGFHDKPVDYLFTGTPDVASIIQEYEDPSLIVVMTSDYLWDKNEKFLFDFVEFKRTFICKTIDNFPMALEGVKPADELFIYLDVEIEPDAFFANMQKYVSFQNAELIYTRGLFSAFHIKW